MRHTHQGFLFDELNDEESGVARSLLDQLLADSRLYKDSDSYRELLSFVAKLESARQSTHAKI